MEPNPLECFICNEEYNERERCPRILPCSHTFCSYCLYSVIYKNEEPFCPYCRSSFGSRSVEDLTINRAILEMTELKSKKDSASKDPEKTIDSTNKKSEELDSLKALNLPGPSTAAFDAATNFGNRSFAGNSTGVDYRFHKSCTGTPLYEQFGMRPSYSQLGHGNNFLNMQSMSGNSQALPQHTPFYQHQIIPTSSSSQSQQATSQNTFLLPELPTSRGLWSPYAAYLFDTVPGKTNFQGHPYMSVNRHKQIVAPYFSSSDRSQMDNLEKRSPVSSQTFTASKSNANSSDFGFMAANTSGSIQGQQQGHWLPHNLYQTQFQEAQQQQHRTELQRQQQGMEQQATFLTRQPFQTEQVGTGCHSLSYLRDLQQPSQYPVVSTANHQGTAQSSCSIDPSSAMLGHHSLPLQYSSLDEVTNSSKSHLGSSNPPPVAEYQPGSSKSQ